MRHLIRLTKALLVVLVCIFGVSVNVSSAATLGGLQADSLGGLTASTKQLSGLRLDWNRDVTGSAALHPSTLRITSSSTEEFRAGDVVEVTVEAAAAGTCTTSAAVPRHSPTLELEFTDCALYLWQLGTVSIAVSGSGEVQLFEGNLGDLHGSLSSFDGAVVERDSALETGFETADKGGVRHVERLHLTMADRTVAELLGSRVTAVITPSGNDAELIVTGTIGSEADHQGIWVDAATGGTGEPPRVHLELSTLAAEPPTLSGDATYRLMLLEAQHLGATQPGTRSSAVIEGTGAIPGAPKPEPFRDITQPVNLDPRLVLTNVNNSPSLYNSPNPGFCYTFRVTNTSPEPVTWQVTFDTTRAPMWGLDPRLTSNNNSPGMSNAWNMRTISYTPSNGHWVVAGAGWNNEIPGATPGNPAPYAEGGFCAVGNIPPVDPTTFTAPQISVEPGSDTYSVALRVKVSSEHPYYVPWAAEVDLADYVCASTLPSQLVGENAVLTRISGTRYRIEGSSTANTKFVRAGEPREFVFTRYSPGGKAFLPGTCQ